MVNYTLLRLSTIINSIRSSIRRSYYHNFQYSYFGGKHIVFSKRIDSRILHVPTFYYTFNLEDSVTFWSDLNGNKAYWSGGINHLGCPL